MSTEWTTTLDNEAFRRVLGNFAAGLTVLTSIIPDGPPVGVTCQSFFSVSLEPMMVGFAIGKTSKTFPAIEASGVVCVNVLSSRQDSVSDAFARSGTDKFRGLRWTTSPRLGLPAFEDSLALIECEIGEKVDAGDHTLVLANVIGLDARRDLDPLLYFRSQYARLGE